MCMETWSLAVPLRLFACCESRLVASQAQDIEIYDDSVVATIVIPGLGGLGRVISEHVGVW